MFTLDKTYCQHTTTKHLNSTTITSRPGIVKMAGQNHETAVEFILGALEFIIGMSTAVATGILAFQGLPRRRKSEKGDEESFKTPELFVPGGIICGLLPWLWTYQSLSNSHIIMGVCNVDSCHGLFRGTSSHLLFVAALGPTTAVVVGVVAIAWVLKWLCDLVEALVAGIRSLFAGLRSVCVRGSRRLLMRRRKLRSRDRRSTLALMRGMEAASQSYKELICEGLQWT